MQQETKIGKIKKVAGPLVVAVDVPEAKMYEVVKVGEAKLVGEVIRIEGDEAFIQVYEETSGVGPGEPVYLTGDPLTVELGPGLISGIYDGIQRPLPALQEKSGEYISRGIEARALDGEKKWKLKMLKKDGDDVTAGDIIAEIKETELLTHKVMVPSTVKDGKISSAVKDGEYTIDDTIAKVGNQVIKLAHKWPIRQPRMVKNKLVPNKGLITGQRVIDTFFPIAKGGAGCVPGPFGSGKCVSGDTKVMMGNGRIVTMEDIHQEGREKGKLLKKDKVEEIYDIKGLGNPSVISLEKGAFSSHEPITAYKGMTDSMIKIKTKTGKTVEVTPIHKLFVFEDGEVKRKMAKNIKKSDYLISPRKIKLNLKDQKIDYGKILEDSTGLFSVDKKFNLKLKVYLKRMIKNNELPRKFEQYLRKSRNFPLDLLFTVQKRFNLKLIFDKVCSYHGKTIILPEKMLPEFAEFLGYIMADGNLKKTSYSIRFYNNSKELLDRFACLAKSLFDVEAYTYPHLKGDLSIVQIDCKALFDVLVGLGVPFKQKARNAIIPESVLMSSNSSLASFLFAYINCDGYIDQEANRIEISSSSKSIIEQLSFVLLRFGIVATIVKAKKDGNCRLIIRDITALSDILQYAKIGKVRSLKHIARNKKSSVTDAFPLPTFCKQFLTQPKLIGRLQKKGIYIQSYAYANRNIGHKTFKRMFKKIDSIIAVPERIKKFIEFTENVFFDQVIEVKENIRSQEVYDVEVPKLGNFIGGHGALLLSNTVVQHQIARWSDADIIIYAAVGERGNEVADVLQEFPELKDPKTGRSLMERTILIANTSNMPVAAREASVYTSVTIGEYFRDMGYSVAIVADSTSRWAEALREISGRLEEMPGDEGYPAYLGSRTAAFYERAGYVKCQGTEDREGFLTVVGAVSPPGGDLSEPVTQNTLRVTKVFWALDASLAYKRHFPAINWLTSYTLYNENLKEFLDEQGGEGFVELKKGAMGILQKEAELQEIVRLVGIEAIGQQDQFLMEIARIIREDFLHQNAFIEIDTYTSLEKQYQMIKTIMNIYEKGKQLIKDGKQANEILDDEIKDKLAKMKIVPEENLEQISAINL